MNSLSSRGIVGVALLLVGGLAAVFWLGRVGSRPGSSAPTATAGAAGVDPAGPGAAMASPHTLSDPGVVVPERAPVAAEPHGAAPAEGDPTVGQLSPQGTTAGTDEPRIQILLVHDLPFEFDLDLDGLWLRDPDGIALSLQPGPRLNSFIAATTQRGDHELIVEDPRFESVHLTDLRPSGVRTVALRGSCVLLLELRSAQDGAAVQVASVSSRFPSPPPRWSAKYGGPPELQFQKLHPEGPLPEGGRLGGVYPAEQVLRVDAPGFVPEYRGLEPFVPGEVRVVRLELLPERVLVGRLLWPEGQPARGLATLSLGGAPFLSAAGDVHQTNGGDVLQQSWVSADGRFEFRGLDGGSHALTVEPSPFLVHRFDGLRATEPGAEPQDLVLPEPASIQGSVRASGAASGVLQLVRIGPGPVEPRSLSSHWRLAQSYPHRTSFDGPQTPYRFEALGPGTYELRALPPHSSPPHGLNIDGPVLATLTLVSGERRQLDLEVEGATAGTGVLEVSVTVDSRSSGGLTLIASRRTEGSHSEYHRLDLDSLGRGRFPHLAPGEYALAVESGDGVAIHWIADGPSGVLLSAGETRVVAFDLELHSARIRLVPAENAQLPTGLSVAVQPAGNGRPPRHVLRTRAPDSEGLVSWREARGEVLVTVYRAIAPTVISTVAQVRTAWPPEGGELEVQVP
jgi:hypothetical protein